jgi:hypothetical protein
VRLIARARRREHALPMRPLLIALLLAPALAHADSTIKHPGDHPDYKVEIEPHGLVGLHKFGGVADKDAFGAGVRFSIVLVENGFIKSINNSVAISFGADFFFASHNTLFFPVAMQWNFFVAQRWSVFGEPGLAVGHSFEPRTRVHPAFWAGARYHFNEHVALTMRIGYPTFSIGVSFM